MKNYAFITGLLSGLLFGIATPLSKLLLEGFNSFQLAGLLYLGAALAMSPFLFRKNSHVRLLFETGNRWNTLGIIFFGGCLGPILLLAGLKEAHAASVSIWLNMELVATAVLGIWIFKDTIGRTAWLGLILTVLAGIVTSIGEGLGGFTSALLITAACFCWGIDNHLTAMNAGASPQAVTFVKGLVAGSVNFGIGCFLTAQTMSCSGIATALLVGTFSYGFSIVLYVTSAQALGATRGQILFSTAPLWGVVLSYVFLREPFHWEHVVSLILLVGAVMLTSLEKHDHLHVHEFMEHIHWHRHNDGHHDHEHGGKEDIIFGKGHSHKHSHEPMTHRHTHYPDLHHRHNHP